MGAESMRCSWCGAAVAEADYWRAHEDGDGDAAVFCRLEHVVPWVMRGARWSQPVLIHHRTGHEIRETFDSVEALRKWAAGGGPWG